MQGPTGHPSVDEKDQITLTGYGSDKHKWIDMPMFGLVILKYFIKKGDKIMSSIYHHNKAYIIDHRMLTDYSHWNLYFKCGIHIPKNNFDPVLEFVKNEQEIITTNLD